MRLIKRGRLISELIDWQLTEAPEEGVNYQDGRMVTDHERQYEAYILLEEVIKTVAEQETVEAIPIGWIRNYIAKQKKGLRLHDDFNDLDEIWGIIGIETLLDDWRAENEKAD